MTKKKKTNDKGIFGKIFDEVKENISEGAKVFQHESAEVLEKVKEKASEAYETGAEAVETVTEKVHDFTERQKLQKEHNELKNKRTYRVQLFGEAVLQEYSQKGSVYKRFLTTKKMKDLVEDINNLDKRISEINKQLS